MTVYEHIFELYEQYGANAYFGEEVTQLEHALQTANLAAESGASDCLVVAALIHDIGHLLPGHSKVDFELAAYLKHEEIGGRWLAYYFDEETTQPALLHVEAKRYLCATDKGYFEGLSDASKLSLQKQGDAMSREEMDKFETLPFYREALELRVWDDAAKIPGLPVPGLEKYKEKIEAACNKTTFREGEI